MEKEKPTSAPRLPFRRTGDLKLQGELIELAFLHKAVSLGFAVAKPYGDSERYDFIVDYRDNIDRRSSPRLLSRAVQALQHAPIQSSVFH